MGRALKVGDYVELTDKGRTIMGSQPYEIFLITEIGYNWTSDFDHQDSNRLAYNVSAHREDGSMYELGNMFRDEIKLYRVKKKHLPKKRMTFNSWMKERDNA